MAQSTQHWPIRFYHETGVLGVLFFAALSLYLGFWWFQQLWIPVLIICFEALGFIYYARQKQRCFPYHFLGYHPKQGWYLMPAESGLPTGEILNSVEVGIQHLWFGPFFCTLKLRLHDNTHHNHLVQQVVCWRWQMSLTQWRHLKAFLRSIQFGGRAGAQSMREET